MFRVTAEPVKVFQPAPPIFTSNVAVPVGVPPIPEPEMVTDIDTEAPRVMEPEGVKVGAGTVGISEAALACMLATAQIDKEIRTTIIMICSFFMFFSLLFLVDLDLVIFLIELNLFPMSLILSMFLYFVPE